MAASVYMSSDWIDIVTACVNTDFGNADVK